MNLTQRLQLAQQSSEGVDTRSTVRQDGYSSGSPVFDFQRECETSAHCDYNALRATLLWARNRAVSLSDLHSYYVSIKG